MGLLDRIKTMAGLPPGPINAQGLMSDDKQPSLMNTDPVSLGGFNTRRESADDFQHIVAKGGFNTSWLEDRKENRSKASYDYLEDTNQSQIDNLLICINLEAQRMVITVCNL